MLSMIATADVPMGVCTFKLHAYAYKVLEALELNHFFDFPAGSKAKMVEGGQLELLLRDRRIDSEALMTGDRSIDLIAAQSNSLDSAEVLWGYGALDELSAEEPTHLFNSPAELTVAMLQD